MAHTGSPPTDNLQHRMQRCGDGPLPQPQLSRQLLCNHLDYMERELSSEKGSADIRQIKEILLQLAEVIRSGKPLLMSDQYRRILKRLIAIYARGLAHGDKEAFITTATGYADVIEAISQAFPGYDYSEAVGQLLYYMCHQFKIREESWVVIYHHIAAMPGDIGVNQKKQFLEIRRWAEEGVDQLFQIRQNLYKAVQQLDDEIRLLGERIDDMQGYNPAQPSVFRARHSSGRGSVSSLNTAGQGLKQPATEADPETTDKGYDLHKVVDIATARAWRAAQTLIDDQDSLRSQKAAKVELVGLIEDNIREFETLLKNARRAYLLRLV